MGGEGDNSEGEVVGWRSQLNEHEFELEDAGVGDGREMLCTLVHGVAKSQKQD